MAGTFHLRAEGASFAIAGASAAATATLPENTEAEEAKEVNSLVASSGDGPTGSFHGLER